MDEFNEASWYACKDWLGDGMNQKNQHVKTCLHMLAQSFKAHLELCRVNGVLRPFNFELSRFLNAEQKRELVLNLIVRFPKTLFCLNKSVAAGSLYVPVDASNYEWRMTDNDFVSQFMINL